jgi:hypothetical protein
MSEVFSVGTTVPAAVAADPELLELAEEIREHHKAVEGHARGMLDEAILAGSKLNRAKARLRHGDWQWYRAYCGIPERTDRLYRQLAREAETGNVAVLRAESIRGALRALGEQREDEPEPKPPYLGPRHAPRSEEWQVKTWREAMVTEGRTPRAFVGKHSVWHYTTVPEEGSHKEWERWQAEEGSDDGEES